MRLNWGPHAKRDLYELISYVAEDSVQAAELVATRVLVTAERLSERPHVGRPGRVKGTRELVILRTP
jgi:toxin ParE1/3/4